MARPIKETPILYGEDARRFEARMKERRRISAEELSRSQDRSFGRTCLGKRYEYRKYVAQFHQALLHCRQQDRLAASSPSMHIALLSRSMKRMASRCWSMKSATMPIPFPCIMT